MKTVKEAKEAIINRVSTALNLNASELKTLFSSEDNAALPEGLELTDESLKSLISLDFAQSDEETWNFLHSKVIGKFMPDFEKAQRKVFEDAIGQSKFFNTKQINDAFNDPNHKRANQRLFAGLNAMIDQMKEAVKEAGTAAEDQQKKMTALQERANELQAIVDGLDGKIEQAVTAKESELQKQILEMSLLGKAKDLGAKFPSDRMARFWAMEALEKADWRRENGELKAFKKGTDLPLTDKEKGATISAEQFLQSDLVDFIPRNNGQGETTPPKKTFEPGKNSASGLPEGIKPGTAAHQTYLLREERKKARLAQIQKP